MRLSACSDIKICVPVQTKEDILGIFYTEQKLFRVKFSFIPILRMSKILSFVFYSDKYFQCLCRLKWHILVKCLLSKSLSKSIDVLYELSLLYIFQFWKSAKSPALVFVTEKILNAHKIRVPNPESTGILFCHSNHYSRPLG